MLTRDGPAGHLRDGASKASAPRTLARPGTCVLRSACARLLLPPRCLSRACRVACNQAPTQTAADEAGRGSTPSPSPPGVRTRRWTPEQASQFEAAVHALGGPSMATGARVLLRMPQGGVAYERLRRALKKGRDQMRDAGGASAPADEALAKRRPMCLGGRPKLWTADLHERVDAAVATLGGLSWATATGIQHLVPDAGLSRHTLGMYLMIQRRTGLRRQAAAEGGAEEESGSTGPEYHPGYGPPRGWLPEQSHCFLAAVRASGGSPEATTRGVYEWMQRTDRGGGALSLKQVQIGLQRLGEMLRSAAALSSATLPTEGQHDDARAREDDAIARLWVQGVAKFRWTPELRCRLEAAVQQLGGPREAKPAPLLALMAGSGLTWRQAEGGLKMLRDALGAGGGASPSPAATPAGEGKELATQTVSPVRWTAELRARCDAAVAQLGGVERATTLQVVELMAGSGLRRTQLANRMMRLRARPAGASGSSEAAALPSGPA